MSLTRSKAVLELGKRLVAQLGAADDLLAAWMAHYIAERMEAAESAPAETKDAAQEACARAILELWQHRAGLPEHLRPLAEIEPVLRTLAFLDVERTRYGYHAHYLQEAATAQADPETKEHLEFAIGLDYSARVLIRFILTAAADRSASLVKPWIELVRQSGWSSGVEAEVVEWVLGPPDSDKLVIAHSEAALRDKADRLEAFAQLASSLSADLRARLGESAEAAD